MTVIYPLVLVLGLVLLVALAWWMARSGQPGSAASRGMRLVMLGLLLTGAASPVITRSGSGRLRVYVLDVSGSHHDAASAALDRLAASLQASASPEQAWSHEGDRAALVLFDSRAWLAVPPSSLPEFAERCGALVSELPEGLAGSDLAAGLQLGARVAASVEAGAAELLLISDGCHLGPREQVLAASRDCLALGNRVLALEPGAWGGRLGARPGIAVVGLRGPGQVAANEPAGFMVEVRATAAAFDGWVALQVRSLGEAGSAALPRVTRRCRLRSGGVARLLLTTDPVPQGLYRVDVEVEGLDGSRPDEFAADDRRQVLLQVGQSGLALVFASPDRAQAPVRDALLRSVGMVPRVVNRSSSVARGAARALADWSSAELVVIDGLGRDELGDETAGRLRELVVEGGAGLLVLGGDRAFAAGGWQGSPLADILPVVPDPEESTRLAVVVCLDASGSMAEPWAVERSESRWQRAVGALLPSPNLRSAESLVVIPFDSQAREPIALGRGEQAGVQFSQALLGLRPRGGTDCFAALARAREVARASGAERRIIVLLSDGDTRESDESYRQLESSRRADMETSVRVLLVEGGGDDSESRLRRIARAAGGELRAVAGWDEIVDILRDEVIGDARGLIGRGPAPVAVVSRGPLAGDPPAGDLALVDRWNRTRAREQVPPLLVVGESREPLLAVAPAGSGRAVALTSALTPDWLSPWLVADAPQAEVAKRWLADAVGWARRGGRQAGLSVTAQALGEGRVEVVAAVSDTRSSRLRGPVGPALVARLGPNQRPLLEVEPGRFQGVVALPASGLSEAELVVVEEASPSSASSSGGALLRGVAMVKPVSVAEWRRLEPDRNLLRALCQAGGGKLVGANGRAAAAGSTHRLRGHGRPLELRSWLVVFAVVLLLGEASSRLGSRWRRA